MTENRAPEYLPRCYGVYSDISCGNCPYRRYEKEGRGCIYALHEDALALLKEQEPVKVRHLHGTKVTVHEEIVFTDECENCSGYLLKHWKACPICGKPVIWE